MSYFIVQMFVHLALFGSYQMLYLQCSWLHSGIENAKYNAHYIPMHDIVFINNQRDEDQKATLRIGTADLLDMLIHNEPDVDFTLALGADTFIDLASGKWRRTEDIFHLVGYRMVVFRRLSEEESNNNNNDDDGGKKKDELLQESVAKYSTTQSSSIKIIEIPTLSSVSSSAVRRTTDETILKEMLSSNVLDYIRQNQMYSFSD